nr:hypothetical protein [Tanacetum cinerariifolium]
MESQSETTQTMSILKLSVLKTEEYDLWSMSAGAEGPIPPKTAKQKLARKNELKAKSTLMLAIPDEHLLKFHACKDAKFLLKAIKNSLEGLDKTYDRFQKLISQLEIHVEVITQEDANPKLLRRLPSVWNNIALIMRNKSDLDTLSMRGHFARECRAPRNQGNKNRDASTRNAPVDTSTTNALVVQDGIGGYDWSFQAEEELTKFALMAYTSQGLSSSSSLDSKLENALKEKYDLKLKLEEFESSSKNLTKLINSQISAIDKTGLGYDGQMNESDLNDIHVNESEVINNVFDCRESDRDDNQVNERFKKGEGYHVVPPPYTGNYMPPRADLSFTGLDNSIFKSKMSETITSVPKIKANAPKLWIEEFVPMDTELVKGSDKVVEGSEKAEEGSSKRAAGKLEQGDAKKQRIEEDNESAKLKRCLEIIPKDDDDVTIKATLLSSNHQPLLIIRSKKERRKSFFNIIKADGNSQNYLTFGKMFKNFYREDLEVL